MKKLVDITSLFIKDYVFEPEKAFLNIFLKMLDEAKPSSYVTIYGSYPLENNICYAIFHENKDIWTNSLAEDLGHVPYFFNSFSDPNKKVYLSCPLNNINFFAFEFEVSIFQKLWQNNEFKDSFIDKIYFQGSAASVDSCINFYKNNLTSLKKENNLFPYQTIFFQENSKYKTEIHHNNELYLKVIQKYDFPELEEKFNIDEHFDIVPDKYKFLHNTQNLFSHYIPFVNDQRIVDYSFIYKLIDIIELKNKTKSTKSHFPFHIRISHVKESGDFIPAFIDFLIPLHKKYPNIIINILKHLSIFHDAKYLVNFIDDLKSALISKFKNEEPEMVSKINQVIDEYYPIYNLYLKDKQNSNTTFDKICLLDEQNYSLKIHLPNLLFNFTPYNYERYFEFITQTFTKYFQYFNIEISNDFYSFEQKTDILWESKQLRHEYLNISIKHIPNITSLQKESLINISKEIFNLFEVSKKHLPSFIKKIDESYEQDIREIYLLTKLILDFNQNKNYHQNKQKL